MRIAAGRAVAKSPFTTLGPPHLRHQRFRFCNGTEAASHEFAERPLAVEFLDHQTRLVVEMSKLILNGQIQSLNAQKLFNREGRPVKCIP